MTNVATLEVPRQYSFDAYGEEGSCWETESAAEACDEACKAAIVSAHDAWPREEACDDGSPPELVLDSASWTFLESGDDCDGIDNFVEFDATLIPGEFEEFQFHGDLTFGIGKYVYDNTRFDCVADGFDFSCDDEYENSFTLTFRFSGTFGNNSDTATAVGVFLWPDERIECTTTMVGTRE